MIRIIAAACALACAIVTTAEARSALHPDCNVTMPCEVVRPFRADVRGPLQPQMFTRKKERQARAAPQSWGGVGSMTVSPARVAGLVPELAAKVSQIVSTCGSKVVSGVRHTNIAGTRRRSLHSTGQAADLQGNPSCIYSMLHGWPGGDIPQTITPHPAALTFTSHGAASSMASGSRIVTTARSDTQNVIVIVVHMQRRVSGDPLHNHSGARQFHRCFSSRRADEMAEVLGHDLLHLRPRHDAVRRESG